MSLAIDILMFLNLTQKAQIYAENSTLSMNGIGSKLAMSLWMF